jgi:hypothetical protein
MNPSARVLARWIEFVSWAFVVLGITLPLTFHAAPFASYREALANWAVGAATIPDADVDLVGLLLGITGGSIAGKWIVHACLARGPLAEGRAWARDLTLRGLALWFLVDSACSLRIGAAFNVWMINLAPLLLVGLPLWLSRSRFEDEPAPVLLPAAAVLCRWTSLFGASTGLVIAVGGATPLFGPWFAGLESAHYGGAALTDGARRLALFFFGPVGGCVLAQFVLLTGLVLREGASRRVAAAGVLSIGGWFFIDSAWGLVHDGLFNILLVNLPSMLVTLPPWVWLAHVVAEGDRLKQPSP